MDAFGIIGMAQNAGQDAMIAALQARVAKLEADVAALCQDKADRLAREQAARDRMRLPR